MGKSIVSIVRGSEPDALVKEATDLIGGIGSIVRPGSTVVIKPNVGAPAGPETSVCTSPGMVAAAIRLCRAVGARTIIVGEAAATGLSTTKSFEVSGVGASADAAGADAVLDFKASEAVWVRVANPDGAQIKHVDLPKVVLDADVLISLPILKTHYGVQMTAAIKNMKGLLKDVDKRRFHLGMLNQAIADLMLAKKPDLSIVDALRPQEGLGPSSGTPVEGFGVVVAGVDPLAVDATCARIIGCDPYGIDYLLACDQFSIGVMNAAAIEVRGKSIDEVKRPFQMIPPGFSGFPEYKIFDSGACSSCQGVLIGVLDTLKQIGRYDQNAGVSIILGAKKMLPEGCGTGKDLIVMGNCAARWKKMGVFAPGCPPVLSTALIAIAKREEERTKPS